MANANPSIELRQTTTNDLETLFNLQMDEDWAYMAAFVNENWRDKEAYLSKWTRLLVENKVNMRTIIWNNVIAGSIATYNLMGELQITYGLGKDYWGNGIATIALQQFLEFVSTRPLYGRVAFDNTGSMRVLMKCGFRKIKEEKYYAYARQMEIDEMVFILEQESFNRSEL